MRSRVLRALQSDASRATASTVIRSVGRIVAMIVLARVADVGTLAIYTVMTAVEQVVVSAANAMCSSPAAVISAGRRDELRRAALLSAERMQVWSAVPIVVIAVAGFIVWGAAPDIEALAFGAALLAGIVYQARRSSMIALFRSSRILWAEMVIAAAVALGPVIAVNGSGDPLVMLWVLLAVSQLAALPLLSISSARASKRAMRVVRRSIVSAGWRMLAGSLAVSAGGRSQSMILAAFVAPGMVAMYGVANSFAAPIRLVGGAVRAPLLPRIALCSAESVRAAVTPVRMAAVVAAIAACSLLAQAAAPACIALVYGDRYAEAAQLVGPFVAWALVWCVGSLLVIAHQAAGRSGWCAAVRWVGAAGAVGGMVAGAAVFGVTGVVWAALLGEAAVVSVFVSGLHPRRARVLSRVAAAVSY